MWKQVTMKILFKNARILTMKDENIIFANLVVKDNRIAYIGKDYSKYAPFDREIECLYGWTRDSWRSPGILE